ncbi:MAG: hypothetical protein JWM09_1400, partial [Francisellaceae bacterium]|nr:hypothetical protein [Francisellaceae bacterium]
SNSEILIVEDVEISLRVAVRNLKINGYSVETASSPAEALEKYKSHKGTLKAILMDIDLGNTISGIEVSSQIRELELNSEIKVSPILILALTGNVSLENIKEYENAGMNGCILKGRDLTSSLKIAMEQSLQNPGLFVSLILPDLRKISPSTSNSHVLGLKSPLLHSPSTSPLPTWPSYDNQEIILNFQKIDFEKKKKNKLIKNENEEKKHSLSSPK